MAIADWGTFIGGIAAGVGSTVGFVTFIVARRDKAKQSAKETNAQNIQLLGEQFETQRQKQQLEFEKKLYALQQEHDDIKRLNQTNEEKLERMSRVMDASIKRLVDAAAPEFSSLVDTIEVLEERVEQEQQSKEEADSQLQSIKIKLQETKISLATLPNFVDFHQTYDASGKASAWLMNKDHREDWTYDAADASKKAYPATLRSEDAYNKLLVNINQCLGWLAFSLREYIAVEPPEKMLESLHIETKEAHQFALQWLLDHRVIPHFPAEQATEASTFLNLLLKSAYWSNGS